MALDGISLNQLRIVQENTSKENAINSQMLANVNNGSRSVNSMDKKSAIDTDDKENTSFFGGESSEEESQENEEETNDSEETVEFQKVDLSNKDLYEIRVNESTNSLAIYDKQRKETIQEITPGGLSTLVDNLKNPCGVLINKRI